MTGRLIETLRLMGVCASFLAFSFSDAMAEEVKRPDAYPPGELGEWVKLGEAIVKNTIAHPMSKPYVGNRLNCTSCHLDAGTHKQAASFLGTAAAYPAWSPREKSVITLEDRVVNCFIRSQNGSRPPIESKVPLAISTYITWLSIGYEIQMNAEAPLGPNRMVALRIQAANANITNGKRIYQNQCADCHGQNGEGNDEGPPVWGMESYNDGAGMAGNDKLAAWLKVAMPLDDPNLSDQEAVDVAAYVNSHERPVFRETGESASK
jgi:thiosulfate dehydrogenase